MLSDIITLYDDLQGLKGLKTFICRLLLSVNMINRLFLAVKIWMFLQIAF